MFKINTGKVLSIDLDKFEFSWEDKDDLFIGGTIEAWADEQIKAGFPRKLGGANGYKGWICNKVLYGQAAQGGFCSASGVMASRIFHALQGSPGLRCSRIDLQATVELRKVEQRLAHCCHKAVKDAAAQGLPNIPRKTPFHGEDDSGWTVYLGAPSSDKRCRIYDKGGEQGLKELGLYWRFEYQLRRKYAKAAYKALVGTGSFVQIIASQVSRWLADVGISLDLGDYSGDPICVGRQTATDDEKSIEWLRKGVAPSIYRLAAGDHKQELRALVASWALAVGLLEPDEV